MLAGCLLFKSDRKVIGARISEAAPESHLTSHMVFVLQFLDDSSTHVRWPPGRR